MRVDHVALNASKMAETVKWYTRQFGATVLYQDETWAFLKVGGSKIALVTPGQHPPHVAFAVTPERLGELSASYGKATQPHRDGTSSFYVEDPSGNAIELIAYPTGHAYGAPQARDSVAHP
jgi:catechol 2,3-dioxygenase-like lactoylglutathione lyase family enzyme